MTLNFLRGIAVGAIIGLAIVVVVVWVPLWWSDWKTSRLRRKVSQAVLDQLSRDYGTQKFAQQWRAQEWPNPFTGGGVPISPKIEFFDAKNARMGQRREQRLAAVIAGGMFASPGLSYAKGTLIDEDEMAADALAVAREIISQSEKSDSPENQKPDPK